MSEENTTPKGRIKLDLADIRRRLEEGRAEETWRSLEEVAETEEFLEFLHEEFPQQTSWKDKINRRDFLKLLAGPLALAGLSACLPQPLEKIVPYVDQPPQVVPGEGIYFATAMELDGYARGLLVQSREGRPIKAEGNPIHPASLGATDTYAQASILTLYDPSRAKRILNKGQHSSWNDLQAELSKILAGQGSSGGAGLHILTGTVTSPTLANQLNSLTAKYPNAQWHLYDPVSRDQVRQGAALAFGEVVDTQYKLDTADVILVLDSDWMFREAGNLRYIREFSTRRSMTGTDQNLNRMYVVESSLTITGASADHRWPVQAGQVEAFAREVASRLGVNVPTVQGAKLPVPANAIDAIVADLKGHSGSSVVIAGSQQPPSVHALAHAMNAQLGNVGKTVFYTEPVEAKPVDQTQSMANLVQALDNGQVKLLVILGENPAYSAPPEFHFGDSLKKAATSVYLSLYNDETSGLVTWHVPMTHFLEEWSDTRAFDGTVSLIQPLIYPLYECHSKHEILASLQGQSQPDMYTIVQQYWQNAYAGSGIQGSGGTAPGQTPFDLFWRSALERGVIPNTQAATRNVNATANLSSLPSPAPAQGMEIVFEPDYSVWDGRFYSNAWMQELPKPTTKLVWDNAALMSPATALNLGVTTGDIVELSLGGNIVNAPVWVQPGLPGGTVVAPLGYGQQLPIAKSDPGTEKGLGFNAYLIRQAGFPWHMYGLQVRKIGDDHSFATSQIHQTMNGRNLVRVANLQEYQANPKFAQEEASLYLGPNPLPEKSTSTVVPEPPSIYPQFEYKGNAWGMTINLNTCIGCEACVIACEVENNTPVVGKEEVNIGRMMHWLRIDRYYQGGTENPNVYFEPVPCMHCQKAPCEVVCPVGATTHSSEGLNTMIYNRCIGTRYCSNNCPYKVRRFNFIEYVDWKDESLKMWRNPEVSVRVRGVMEKCTYCVQRIAAARIKADSTGTPIKDGEIWPACAQACPSNAIVFGDINDSNSEVRRLKEHPRNYGLLADTGTQPRTTYLALVRNPNPDITA